MKKLLLTAALLVAIAAPAFAADDLAKGEGNAPAASVTATTTIPAATTTTTTTTTTADPAAAAKTACTTETNEKVKLPENAGDAEKAQWDAAFAECVKGKGVAEVTPATTDALPAGTDPEAAGDTADKKAAE